jgi:hypothetical protein
VQEVIPAEFLDDEVGEDFQRDIAVQHLIVRAIDEAHSSFADSGDDAVVADQFANHRISLSEYMCGATRGIGGDVLHTIALEETSHFQITKGILQNPAVYSKHLQENGPVQEEPAETQTRKRKSPGTRRSNASGS